MTDILNPMLLRRLQRVLLLLGKGWAAASSPRMCCARLTGCHFQSLVTNLQLQTVVLPCWCL